MVARLARKGGGSRRAFTLTETVIVLGIVGIVLGAIWLAASVVWKNYQVYSAKNQILAVVQKTRDYYGPSAGHVPAGPAEITATLIGLRILPLEMLQDPGAAVTVANHALSSEVGGAFRVYSVDASGRRLRVQLRALEPDSCMQLLMNFPVLTPEVGVILIGTALGSTPVNLANVADPSTIGVPLPLQLPTVQALCSLPNKTNEVDIDFRIPN
ncbi:MAG: prepilin-type N-terminal cleavage/methylation domain-containing protein [Alphaproteobacteria bacterium]|nr:prepilin-type N-terminal cleavage/methylation domain-containing protein [Alphaproteobacteria bacterium]